MSDADYDKREGTYRAHKLKKQQVSHLYPAGSLKQCEAAQNLGWPDVVVQTLTQYDVCICKFQEEVHTIIYCQMTCTGSVKYHTCSKMGHLHMMDDVPKSSRKGFEGQKLICWWVRMFLSIDPVVTARSRLDSRERALYETRHSLPSSANKSWGRWLSKCRG